MATDSTPDKSESEPKTSFTNALGSLSGVFTLQSSADHQKIRWNSASRPCIFVKVEPLRSKKTFGFQRAISAAHSYSGLPQCAPTTVIFGKRLAISSRWIGRIRPERVLLSSDAARFDNRLPGTVEFVSYLGSSIDVHVRVSPAERIVVSQPNRLDGAVPKEGDETEVCWQL